MKYLAIDYGTKHVGVAVSDPAGEIAFPHTIINGAGDADLLKALAAIVARETIEAIVVGLPIHPDGALHPNAVKVQEFAKKLGTLTGKSVEFLDERFTTALVTKLRASVRDDYARDDVAAAVLLQNYIDRRGNTKKYEG